MADEDGATAAVRSPSHGCGDSSDDGVDSISALPDEILQTILSSLPTNFAIRTSILSKRWKHVWCETPCLNFDWCGDRVSPDSINKTLSRYKARKMKSVHLCHTTYEDNPYIEGWIEFAKSRNVENMTLDLASHAYDSDYKMPHSFFINSSVKQITLYLGFYERMIPGSSVSWTSLKELFLRDCNLSDGDGSFMPRILSGCPVLGSLTLHKCNCNNLYVFDLSKSLRLRTLEIVYDCWGKRRIQIVAPHLHRLSLTVPPYWPCELLNVSSLIEARLDVGFNTHDVFHRSYPQRISENIVAKLMNVEKLTLGENIIKFLSLAVIRRLPLPLFKLKALTFETMISKYVILGIVKLLQSSPELKKVTVHLKDGRIIPDEYSDYYLDMYGPKPRVAWSLAWTSEAKVFKKIIRNNLESTHMALFMELVLKRTKTLENMVVRLGSNLEEKKIEELLEMVPMLSHDNNNVSITLSSTTKSDQRFKCYNFILKG